MRKGTSNSRENAFGRAGTKPVNRGPLRGSKLLRNETELLAIDPARGVAGFDQAERTVRTLQAERVARGKPWHDLAFGRGREVQGSVLLQNETEPGPALDSKRSRYAKKQERQTKRSDRLMPSAFFRAKNAGKESCRDGNPKAANANPCPPIHRQPGGDDFVPGEFRRFYLCGFAGEAQIFVRGLVE